MPRSNGRNLLRSRIAHLAARIMAEDGIDDYGLAKRKAARQAGSPGSRDLPDNDEIDEALAAYREIYQRDAHRERLRALRETAVALMHDLARFDPHLTGPVLTGQAGKYSGVDLQVFTDDSKGLELFFLDRGIAYRVRGTRLYAGDRERDVPLYTVERDGFEVTIAQLSLADLRGPVRATPGGRAIDRVRLDDAAALLAST